MSLKVKLLKNSDFKACLSYKKNIYILNNNIISLDYQCLQVTRMKAAFILDPHMFYSFGHST